MYLFSGGGPSWASAIVGAAKVKECTPDHALAIQVEEYHHYNSQKVARAARSCWRRPGASVARARDTAAEAKRFGGQAYVATTEGETAFAALRGRGATASRRVRGAQPVAHLPACAADRIRARAWRSSPRRRQMTLGSRSASLLCIGNLTADEAIQPDGSRSLDWAGDALYTALAARAHLDRVTWLAPIGADFPQQLLDDLELAGVAAADSRRRDLPTVRNVVTYRADGTRRWELVHGEEHFDAMSVHAEDIAPHAARRRRCPCLGDEPAGAVDARPVAPPLDRRHDLPRSPGGLPRRQRGDLALGHRLLRRLHAERGRGGRACRNGRPRCAQAPSSASSGRRP